MQLSSFYHLPPLFFLLVLVFAVVVAALQVGVLRYAYEQMGISRTAAYGILLASLAGSMFNIPLAELSNQQIEMVQVKQWGVTYNYPIIREAPSTRLLINVGGAMIPTLLSIYLVVKNQIYLPAAIGIFAVSAVVYRLAEPIDQMGIAVPMFIPPIVAALVAMLLSRDYAAPLAYVSGCMGTLIGADILNLGTITQLNSSLASIGGAGTFDAVFLTGILAVLLAGRPPIEAPVAPSGTPWPHEQT